MLAGHVRVGLLGRDLDRALEARARLGRVAGRLYAIGTIGSLTGTFASSLLLIPLVGTQRTFLIYALVLALVVLPTLGRRWVPGAAVAVVIVLLMLTSVPLTLAGLRVARPTYVDDEI